MPAGMSREDEVAIAAPLALSQQELLARILAALLRIEELLRNPPAPKGKKTS